MDIRQANKLDDVISIDEINYGNPFVKIFKAALHVTILYRFDNEFWSSLPEGEKKALLDRLKEYLKRRLMILMNQEIEDNGETWIEIKKKPCNIFRAISGH